MVTISEVLFEYREFAKGYNIRNSEPTKEFMERGIALRPVQLLYGDLPACDFGPLKLKTVREHMIEVMELSRGVINNRVNLIKRFFRWAVAEETVPPSVIHGLNAVAGARKGRTNARETDPVQPVADHHVEAVFPFVSPQIATMIQLQRMTGMRPGEGTLVRPCDIDMRGDIWIYSPNEHKNDYRGHVRMIPFGPKAQQLLKPFLENNRDPTA